MPESASRGVSATEGVCSGGCLLLGGGGVCPGGCLLSGDLLLGGLLLGYLFWGVSTLGGCLLRGGYLLLGGGIPSCTEADPPVDRITDACKNITLAQLRCSR